LPVKEFCVFAANYIWPQRTMVGEQLVLVIHVEPGQTVTEDLRQNISALNSRLLNYKRIHGIVLFEEDFHARLRLRLTETSWPSSWPSAIAPERFNRCDGVAAFSRRWPAGLVPCFYLGW